MIIILKLRVFCGFYLIIKKILIFTLFSLFSSFSPFLKGKLIYDNKRTVYDSVITETHHYSINCKNDITYFYSINIPNTAVIFHNYDKDFSAEAKIKNKNDPIKIGEIIKDKIRISGIDFGHETGDFTIKCRSKQDKQIEFDAIVYDSKCEENRIFSNYERDSFSLSNYSMIFTESNINNENNQHSLCYIHFSDSNIFNMKTEYNIKFDKTQNKNHLYVCEGNEECFQLIDHGFTSRDYHTTTTIIWNSPKIDNNTEYLKLSVSPSKSANQTITKSHIMSLKSFVQGTSYNALLSDENEYNNTNSNESNTLRIIFIVMISIVSFITLTIILFIIYSLIKAHNNEHSTTTSSELSDQHNITPPSNNKSGKRMSNLEKLKAEPPLLEGMED